MIRGDVPAPIAEAWTRLSAGIAPDHPLWVAFVQAVGFLHEALCFGVPPLAILDAVLISSPVLREPETARDVEMILRNIASDKTEELMALETGTEPSVWRLC
jgi:hypothetical protein